MCHLLLRLLYELLVLYIGLVLYIKSFLTLSTVNLYSKRWLLYSLVSVLYHAKFIFKMYVNVCVGACKPSRTGHMQAILTT
jgi:hypothetical protein